MQRRTMNNPYFARRVWNRLRDRRPIGGRRTFRTAPEAPPSDADQLQDELAAVFKGIGDAPTPPQSPIRPTEGDQIMIKLNAGVSRKVGEPNYGSRGASVNVELELESAVVNDTEALHEKIRKLFALAKRSVDEELGVSTSSGASAQPTANGTNGGQNGTASRPATDGQKRAIWALCNKLGLDQDEEARATFDRPVSQLTLPEASQLIDRLKGLADDS